jgi:hypothetical protein
MGYLNKAWFWIALVGEVVLFGAVTFCGQPVWFNLLVLLFINAFFCAVYWQAMRIIDRFD